MNRNKKPAMIISLTSFKLIIRYFVISVLLVFSFHTHNLSASAIPEGSTQKHCLWSVENSEFSIYLMGSVHILTEDSYPLPAILEKAYADSEIIAFEVDLGIVQAPAFSSKMLSEGRYVGGQSLRDNVPNETFQLLLFKTEQSGLPIELFAKLKPWSCAVSITALELDRLGFKPDYGLDSYFYYRAITDRKEVIALESGEFQLEVFTSMSKAEQKEFLKKSLKELDVLADRAEALLTAWKRGDLRALNRLLEESYSESPELHDKMVTARNRDWMPKINKLFDRKENLIIIVGAAHLVGDDSVVDLLRKAGRTVTQL